MNGHQLILGELQDFVTGEALPDTHDERYRQKIARLLIKSKGYTKDEIRPRCDLLVRADDKQAIIQIDFKIVLDQKDYMLIRYGPGSIVTRRRPALAAARLLAPFQIPVIVVTNGEDAEIISNDAGRILDRGLDAIPAKGELLQMVAPADFSPISRTRAERESRILYFFDVDGSCACDDTICCL